jgi:hypothetical protein
VPADRCRQVDVARQCGLIAAELTHTDLTMQSVCNTVRTLRNETAAAVKAIEAKNPNVTIEELMLLVSGKIGRNAYVTGEGFKGLPSAGHALAFIDRGKPLAATVGPLEHQIRQALEHLPYPSAQHCS